MLNQCGLVWEWGSADDCPCPRLDVTFLFGLAGVLMAGKIGKHPRLVQLLAKALCACAGLRQPLLRMCE